MEMPIVKLSAAPMILTVSTNVHVIQNALMDAHVQTGVEDLTQVLLKNVAPFGVMKPKNALTTAKRFVMIVLELVTAMPSAKTNVIIST